MRRGTIAHGIITIALITAHFENTAQTVGIVIVEAAVTTGAQPTHQVVRIVVAVLVNRQRRRGLSVTQFRR